MEKDVIKALFKSIGYTHCEKVYGVVTFQGKKDTKMFLSWESAERFLKEKGVVNG